MTQDQSRAEFEAWWSSLGQFFFTDYSKPYLLQGWQAARAAAPALPPTLNDAMRAVLINEHDVYQTPEALYEALLAAHRGGEEASNQAETRMDTGVDRGCEVLPETIEKALHWIDCDTREHVRDCIARNSDPNDIYGSLDQLERILRAAPPAPAGWIPVSERLPEPFTDVIVWPRPTDYCCEAQVDRRGEWSYGVYEHYNGHVNYQAHVTHWMPMIQPRKEAGT